MEVLGIYATMLYYDLGLPVLEGNLREKKIIPRELLLHVSTPFHNPPGFFYFSASMDIWFLYFV